MLTFGELRFLFLFFLFFTFFEKYSSGNYFPGFITNCKFKNDTNLGKVFRKNFKVRKFMKNYVN